MSDNILLIVFGILSLLALLIGCVAVSFAMKSARKSDGELKMAFWAFVALAGFTFGGMCLAYFIIPIVLNHL